MILTQEEIEYAKQAGKIAGQAIEYGKKLIQPGSDLVECLDKIELFITEKTQDNNGGIAFPAQISFNDAAAHFCPLQDEKIIINSTDILKLDLGVHINGIIGDTAATIIFEKDNQKYEELLNLKKASEDALQNTLNIIKTGVTLGEIGLIIQESIAKYDLSPIKNLSGHGLGKYSVHEPPTVPNFNTQDKTELQENQLIAIEPFATSGHGMIYESSNATLFGLVNQKPVRNNFTRDILKDIQKFKGLPFTTRWLTKKHSLAKIRFAFNEMKNNGMIHEYPPLVETKHCLVSQAEHTVIVKEKPIITTKMDDD